MGVPVREAAVQLRPSDGFLSPEEHALRTVGNRAWACTGPAQGSGGLTK